MKNKIFKLSITVILIILLLCLAGCLGETQTFEFSPDLCEYILKMTPEEFINCNGKGTDIEGLFYDAKIDENGNLLFLMKKRNVEKWKESIFALYILDIRMGGNPKIGVDSANAEIIFDDGYSKILIEGAREYSQTISDDFTEIVSHYGDPVTMYPFLMTGCAYMQIFEGAIADEIDITYIFLNKNGEEIIRKKFTLDPNDYIEFS